MSTEHSLRASDDDRDRLVDQLQRHAAVGRLSLDEYAERVDRVLVARTTASSRPSCTTCRPSPQLTLRSTTARARGS